MRKTLKLIVCASICLLLAGCIKTPNNKVDPYVKMNRFFFAFNTDLDHLVFRPVAAVYSTITPPPLQKGVTNALANVREITTFPNDILQGKVRYAFVDVFRFLINSTVGIGGLFDVASRMGLPKHVNDFGLTLADWEGYKYKSPYLVLPILGPNTFRSGFGQIPDLFFSPFPYVEPSWISWAVLGLKLVDIRARLSPADKLIDNSFDPYVFVRNAYLQQRERDIENNKHDIRPQVDHEPAEHAAATEEQEASTKNEARTNTRDSFASSTSAVLNRKHLNTKSMQAKHLKVKHLSTPHKVIARKDSQKKLRIVNHHIVANAKKG